MLEVIVHPLPELTTEIVESPIPVPGPDDVLVKVEVAASNVKGILLFPSLSLSLGPSPTLHTPSRPIPSNTRHPFSESAQNS